MLYKTLSLVFIITCFAFGAQYAVSGNVTNSDGEPIEGITVAFQKNPQQPETVTDTLGAFSISLNDGIYEQIRIRNMGSDIPKIPSTLEFMAYENFTLASDTVIDIQLSAFSRIFGQVKNSLDAGVANVNLESKMWDMGAESPPWDNSTSDSAGQYELYMENGTVKIWLTPPVDSGYIDESFEINIAGDTLLDIVLSQGAVLSGTVVTADSTTPVSGITVAIEKNADQEETTTDMNGAFSFTLQQKTYDRLRVRNVGMDLANVPSTLEHTAYEPFDLTGDTSVTLVLPVYYHLTGSILDTAGTGVRDVMLTSKKWDMGSESPPWDNATSGAQGAYDLYVSSGENKIWIEPPAGSDYVSSAVVVTISSDSILDIDLVIGATLSGTIYTADSVAVGGLTVALQKGADQPEAVSEPSGAYTITVSPDTFDQLRVRNTGMEIDNVPSTIEQIIEEPFILTASQVLDIYLPPYYRVSGVVQNAEGTPLANVVIVSKAWETGAESPPWDNFTTSGDGTFELYLAAGPNRIDVSPIDQTYGQFDFILNAEADIVKDIIVPEQAKGITRIQPSVVSLGQIGEVIITGVNSNFADGATTLDLGESITINSLNVASPISLIADITVSDTALTGVRSVIVQVDSTALAGPELFTVTAPCSAALTLDSAGETTEEIKIGDGTGTELVIPAGTQITLPAGADSIISYIAPIIQNNNVDPDSGEFLEVQRKFYPESLVFETPVELTFQYQDQDVEGINEDDLKVFKFDDVTGTVIDEYTITAKDTAANTITHEVTGFSLFRLAEGGAQIGVDRSRQAVVSDRLLGNLPNPFNPSTRIRFQLSRQYKDVSIRIFDLNGRLIRILNDFVSRKGLNTVSWNGFDRFGNRIPSGIYIYQIKADKFQSTRSMILLK